MYEELSFNCFKLLYFSNFEYLSCVVFILSDARQRVYSKFKEDFLQKNT